MQKKSEINAVKYSYALNTIYTLTSTSQNTVRYKGNKNNVFLHGSVKINHIYIKINRKPKRSKSPPTTKILRIQTFQHGKYINLNEKTIIFVKELFTVIHVRTESKNEFQYYKGRQRLELKLLKNHACTVYQTNNYV